MSYRRWTRRCPAWSISGVCHSPQAMSGSPTTWCTATYGLTHLTPPWLLHPNEVLDGAITGPYRTAFATSWTVMNNPALHELYRRHGVDLNFLGVIAFRTEWTTQHEKQLMANQAAKMARMLDAQGALVTWDAGGNEFIEVIRTVQACEQLGIKTVFMTGEDSSAGGVPTLLEPLPEADAIVSTGFIYNDLTDLKSLPAVGARYRLGPADHRPAARPAGPHRRPTGAAPSLRRPLWLQPLQWPGGVSSEQCCGAGNLYSRPGPS